MFCIQYIKKTEVRLELTLMLFSFWLCSVMERMNFHSQALEGVNFDCIMGIIYFMSTHGQSIVITAPLERNISFQTLKTEMNLLCCSIWSHQACTLPYIRDRLVSKWEFMACVSLVYRHLELKYQREKLYSMSEPLVLTDKRNQSTLG